MFCPACGKSLADDAKFCNGCGKQINSSVIEIPQTTTEVNIDPVPENKPVAEKKKLNINVKKLFIKIGIGILLTALYVGISAIFLMVLNTDESIVINTIYESDVSHHVTLEKFLEILIDGNRIFNPTMVSTALGIGLYILIYAVPIFAGIALVTTLINKRFFSLNIVFSIISVISAAAVALVTPAAVKFVPELNQAIGVNNGIIFDDIAEFEFEKLVIFAAIAAAFIVAIIIVTIIYNKRGIKNEQI